MTKYRGKEIATAFLTESPHNDIFSLCHCEERSDEEIYAFVIASLNALAFRRGNLVFCEGTVIHFVKERLPRLPFRKPRNDRGVEIATASLWEASQSQKSIGIATPRARDDKQGKIFLISPISF